ncbi:hypothetical protein B0H13DRAFT_2673136 [Mycena leptocephala]|nr:hypothetical protein B0H13DRAFT_2673136 [Mycena leptocephala]
MCSFVYSIRAFFNSPRPAFGSRDTMSSRLRLATATVSPIVFNCTLLVLSHLLRWASSTAVFPDVPVAGVLRDTLLSFLLCSIHAVVLCADSGSLRSNARLHHHSSPCHEFYTLIHVLFLSLHPAFWPEIGPVAPPISYFNPDAEHRSNTLRRHQYASETPRKLTHLPASRNNFPHLRFNWVWPDGTQLRCDLTPMDTYTVQSRVGDVVRAVTGHKKLESLVFGNGDGAGDH